MPLIFQIKQYLGDNINERDVNLMIDYLNSKHPLAYGKQTKNNIKGDASELVWLMNTKGHISELNKDYTTLIECLNSAQLNGIAEDVQKFIDDDDDEAEKQRSTKKKQKVKKRRHSSSSPEDGSEQIEEQRTESATNYRNPEVVENLTSSETCSVAATAAATAAETVVSPRIIDENLGSDLSDGLEYVLDANREDLDSIKGLFTSDSCAVEVTGRKAAGRERGGLPGDIESATASAESVFQDDDESSARPKVSKVRVSTGDSGLHTAGLEESSEDCTKPSFLPLKIFTLDEVIDQLQAAPFDKDRDLKSFDDLVKRIYSVCSLRQVLKMPSILASNSIPCEVLVQGLNIGKEAKDEIKKLEEETQFKVYNIIVEELSTLDNDEPIYTIPFAQFNSLPISLYRVLPGSPDVISCGGFLGTMGTLIEWEFEHHRALYGVTVAHVISSQQGNIEFPSDGIAAKNQNEYAKPLTGRVHTSQWTDSRAPMMIDIALADLSFEELDQDQQCRLVQSDQRQHNVRMKSSFQRVCLELGKDLHLGNIDVVGILRIRDDSEIAQLHRHGIQLLIGGRGDLICNTSRFSPGDSPGHIRFTTNAPLMPGNSGSSVLVYNTVKKECYVIGIFHGLANSLLNRREESYVAVSLSASLRSFAQSRAERIDLKEETDPIWKDMLRREPANSCSSM